MIERHQGTVVAVAADTGHHFSKPLRDSIDLVQGLGVEGDAHAGPHVRHRYLARRRPRLLNLRQVHLIPFEIFATSNRRARRWSRRTGGKHNGRGSGARAIAVGNRDSVRHDGRSRTDRAPDVMEHKVAILRVDGFELAAINRNAHLAEQLQTFTAAKTCLTRFSGLSHVQRRHLVRVQLLRWPQP
jgi:hypothetical protein